MRAEATGENKDASLDVQVHQGNKGATAVERQPRRLALDISPFGKCILASLLLISLL